MAHAGNDNGRQIAGVGVNAEPMPANDSFVPTRDQISERRMMHHLAVDDTQPPWRAARLIIRRMGCRYRWHGPTIDDLPKRQGPPLGGGQ